MRYLVVFMLLVGVFVLGKRSCHFANFGNGVKGTGPIQTETRSVSGFQRIELDMAGDVEVTTGEFNVQVNAQGNLLPILKTEVIDGTLRIYFSENVSYSENVLVKVSAPAFDGFNITGSGEINCLGPIQSDKLVVSVEGSGDVAIPQATLNTLEGNIIGSGDLVLGGKANSALIDINGSGEVMAKAMEINELRIDIAGSGTVTAHVLQVLKADVSGSGDIFYIGEPAIESNISGSGTVKKISQ